LKHHAVGAFDLVVRPGVGDRVVNVDGVFLAEILEDGAGKSFSQVSDDPIGYAEGMLDVSDEIDRVGGWVFVNRSAPTCW
jgi:hypothetical protein